MREAARRRRGFISQEEETAGCHMGKSAAATFLHSQAETLTMQRRAAVCVPGTWVPAEPGIIFHLGQEYMCLPVLAVLYFLETSQAAILPVKKAPGPCLRHVVDTPERLHYHQLLSLGVVSHQAPLPCQQHRSRQMSDMSSRHL